SSLLSRPPAPTLFPYTTLFRSRWSRGWGRGLAFGLCRRSHRRRRSARYRNQPLDLAKRTFLDPVDLHDVFGRLEWPVLGAVVDRSEEHTSELQSRSDLVCRLLL